MLQCLTERQMWLRHYSNDRAHRNYGDEAAGKRLDESPSHLRYVAAIVQEAKHVSERDPFVGFSATLYGRKAILRRSTSASGPRTRFSGPKLPLP